MTGFKILFFNYLLTYFAYLFNELTAEQKSPRQTSTDETNTIIWAIGRITFGIQIKYGTI